MRTIKTNQTTLPQVVRSTGPPSDALSFTPLGAVDDAAVVFIIDSIAESRDSLRRTLETHDFKVQVFGDSKTFLAQHQVGARGCILVNVSATQPDGIAFIETLKSYDCGLAVIAMAKRVAPAQVVEAMKAGASDCLDLPISDDALVTVIARVIEEAAAKVDHEVFRALSVHRVATLTPRQRQILDLITVGHPSKNIAADLEISQRTVENHRAAIARKTASKSFSDVVRTANCANCSLMKARH